MSIHDELPNVVLIGASAGGVKLIEKLLAAFEGLPPSIKENTAIVICQHLSEASKSLMKEILERTSSGFEVKELFESMKLQKNVCYLNQPGRYSTYDNGDIIVKEFEAIDRKEPTFLINKCFSSFAGHMDDFHLVFGIVLSGAGSDGALGLLDLKEAGAFCIAQDPEEAEVNGMPQAAINKEAFHEVLFLSEITQSIENIVLDKDLIPLFKRKKGGIDYEIVSNILRDAFKFHELNIKYYRFPSLVRGIIRRMTKLGLNEKESEDQILEYKKHYEENKASESFNLVHGLLISYTKFFRDSDVWVEVARSVIPGLLDDHMELKLGSREKFKVWSVGCATGEEAYTLALIVSEVCRIREVDPKNVKIFATDISEKNILRAQEGIYKLEALADIPAEYHSYIKIDKEAGTFTFSKQIKDLITFSVHDILVMAPLSKVSLISCRNLLIYIRSLYQQSVFENLSFGLKKGGRLVLGQAERVNDETLFKADFEKIHLYESLGSKRRFGFTTQRNTIASLKATTQAAAFGGALEGKQIGGGLGTSQPPNTGPAMASALEHVIKRGVLLRSDGLVIRFLGDCRDYFSFPKSGPSFQIEQLALPELMPYLTASLASCLKTRKTVSIGRHDVVLSNGVSASVSMTMEPFDSIDDVDTTYVLLRIFEGEGEGEGEGLTNVMPTGEILADRELVEGLQHELITTKKNLAEALEHHVVTGEELQVTNEELMSSNEELMASNEELKSLNEELQVINQNHTYNQENILKRFSLFNEVLAMKGTFFFIFDEKLIFLDASADFFKASSLSERDFGRNLRDFTFFSTHLGTKFFDVNIMDSLKPNGLTQLDIMVNIDEKTYKVGIFKQSNTGRLVGIFTET